MAKFAQRTPAEHPLLGSVENFGLGENSSLGRKFWVRVKILLGSKILVLGEKRGWSDIDDQSQNGTEARVFV